MINKINIQKNAYYITRQLFVIKFIISILTFNTIITSIPAQNCVNLNFSNNNFGNWWPEVGNCCPIAITGPGPIAGRHTIMASVFSDPMTGGGLIGPPPGFTHVCRLGNSDVGAEAEKITYPLFVDATNSIVTIAYAVVIEEAGHSPSEQPGFSIIVRDQNGNAIPCSSNNFVANPSLPGFSTYTFLDTFLGNPWMRTIYWCNWQTISLDLSANMFQFVYIEAQVGDCGLGGHFGYAYLTGMCSSNYNTSLKYCTNSNSVTVNGPIGFYNYSWSTGQTGNPITIDPTMHDTIICYYENAQGCDFSSVYFLEPDSLVANFTYNIDCGNVILENNSLTYTDSISDLFWDFGDLTTNDTSTLHNTNYEYGQNGSYSVQLIVQNSFGCSDTIIQNIIIDDLPQANFIVADSCGNQISLTDQSTSPTSPITNWNWDMGDGSLISTENVSHTYTDDSTWTIQLAIENSLGCKDTINSPFTNYFIPNSQITFNDICIYDSLLLITDFTNEDNDSLNYSWVINHSDSIYNQNNIVYMFNSSGSYPVSIILNSENGCYDTSTVTVNVFNQPVASFSTDTICEQNYMQYTNTTFDPAGTIVYNNWNFGFPFISPSSVVNPIIYYDTSGVFNTTLITGNNFGCYDTITIPVVVWSKPVANFISMDTLICFPNTFNPINLSIISNGSIESYLWHYGTDSDTNITPSFNTSNILLDQNVSLIVISDKGCSDTITKTNYITSAPKPDANFTFSPNEVYIFSPEVEFINTSPDYINSTWDFNDGQISTTDNPIHIFPVDTGMYLVSLIIENEWGCLDTIFHPIYILPTPIFYIPNSFTPDGDGVNDYFQVRGSFLREVTMTIYNRWGQEIFNSFGLDPVEKGWNGTYKGIDVKQDVYVYKVLIIDLEGKNHELIGNVNLLR
jgi:gliding motility-associated-like protein